MEEVKPEIDERAGYKLAVDADVVLEQMPPARPDDQDGWLGPDIVALARICFGEADLTKPVIHQIDLALDDILPCWGKRILEIGHEDARARIERVDDHFAGCRTCDLNAPVEQVLRDRRDFPIALPDVARAWQKVG